VSGLRPVWLVARRELREGVRGRRFLLSTALILVLLAGIVGLSAFLRKSNTVHVGIAGAAPAGLPAALDAAGKSLDAKVVLHRYASAADARDAVVHRKLDAAFVDGGHGLVVRSDAAPDAVAAAGAAARAAFLPEQARSIGITPAQARAVLATPITVTRLEPASGSGRGAESFALVTTIVLFIAVSIYGQSLLMSVVQEKASRIVEVLLAAVRPRHLLAGKVAGIGVLGLFQVALVALVALGAGLAGAIALPSIGRAAPLAIVCFVLGFTFYAVAFAAAGALVSRVEDASSVATPVTMTMLACYLAALASFSNPDGALATVLTLLPPSAPFTIPARAALTTIPVWEYPVSLALMLAAIWALVRAAGRIYELGLLRTGPRVPFREAFAALRTRRGRYAAAAR
jgi:ABC-2 type transport system permease protein